MVPGFGMKSRSLLCNSIQAVRVPSYPTAWNDSAFGTGVRALMRILCNTCRPRKVIWLILCRH